MSKSGRGSEEWARTTRRSTKSHVPETKKSSSSNDNNNNNTRKRKASNRGYYIVKPVGGCQGRDIFLISGMPGWKRVARAHQVHTRETQFQQPELHHPLPLPTGLRRNNAVRRGLLFLRCTLRAVSETGQAWIRFDANCFLGIRQRITTVPAENEYHRRREIAPPRQRSQPNSTPV